MISQSCCIETFNINFKLFSFTSVEKGIQQDIEEEWAHIKQTIIEAAKDSIQTQNMSLRNKWWDEECKLIMTQKNETRKKYLLARTRASREAYKTKRTEANKVCRRKKRDWINNKIKYIEELNDKKETQKFFKEAQFFNKQHTTLPNFCKDKYGNILSEHQDILQRWKQHVCDLQNLNELQPERVTENITFKNEEEVPPPTYQEVTQVIEKLNTHKSAGPDNITAELIKTGGTALKQRIHKLIVKIWDEETLPREWTEGIFCPIYKKGDRMLCSNYRPITLLNVVYQIFTILINNKLSKTMEDKLEECRMGFRTNRSTIDNLFIVRQIIEKCHEFSIELHNVFIDYTQAFDTVFRDKIIKCLNNKGVPSKLMKLIAKTLQDTKARVKINQTYTEKFEIPTGVKQGDPLSATLFSIVIDDIIKQLEVRGTISTRLKQCSAYADDILITARTKQTLIDTFEKLKNISS